MDEEEITVGLKLSSRRVGKLYPVILDAHGNIVDGLHRLEADPNWPKIRLNHIASDKDRLVARLVANVCRRRVSAEEKSQMLGELGELYVKAGFKPGAEIARKISEDTGMSFRWVMKYLPDKLKERPGIGGPSRHLSLAKVKDTVYECRVANRATLQIEILLSEPIEKVLTVKKYANVNFVQVMLEKRFYAKVEKIAENLSTTPDVILNNVLVLAVRKLMELSNSNKLISIIQ